MKLKKKKNKEMKKKKKKKKKKEMKLKKRKKKKKRSKKEKKNKISERIHGQFSIIFIKIHLFMFILWTRLLHNTRPTLDRQGRLVNILTENFNILTEIFISNHLWPKNTEKPKQIEILIENYTSGKISCTKNFAEVFWLHKEHEQFFKAH